MSETPEKKAAATLTYPTTKSWAIMEKAPYYRWVVMILIFAVYSIATADRANLGMVLPYMKKEFGISNTEGGMLLSLFFMVFAIGQIPIGFLYKKFPTRIIMTVALLATSISTWLIGTSSNLAMMKLYRGLLGISEAPLGIGCGNTINQWFPPKEKGRAMGLYFAAMKAGPVIVPPICAFIIVMWGWRAVFLACAIPGIIFAILWYFMVASKPEESRFVSATELKTIRDENMIEEKQQSKTRRQCPAWVDKLIRTKKMAPITSIREMFLSWNVIGTGIVFLCMSGIINTIMFWIPSYLVTEKGYTTLSMGMMTSSPFVGAVLGNMAGGWISDRIFNKRRKPLMIISTIFTSISIYSLIFAPDNPALLAVMLFLTGFLLNLSYWTFVSFPMAFTSKEIYPLAYSVVNTGGSIGGAFSPLVVGIILDRFKWDMAFMFLAACSVFALFVVLSL
ncbi:MAG: MFS transporter, partial [Sporomusa sp.]